MTRDKQGHNDLKYLGEDTPRPAPPAPIPEHPPYSMEFKHHNPFSQEVTTTGMLMGRTIVEQWEEAGHLFQILTINPPKAVGASVRHFELYIDGVPAYGGRYHSTIKHARVRAEFVARGRMSAQISYLWGLVHEYRARERAREREPDT